MSGIGIGCEGEGEEVRVVNLKEKQAVRCIRNQRMRERFKEVVTVNRITFSGKSEHDNSPTVRL